MEFNVWERLKVVSKNFISIDNKIILHKKQHTLPKSLLFKIFKRSWIFLIIFLLGIVIGGILIYYTTRDITDISMFNISSEDEIIYQDFLGIGISPTFIGVFLNNLTLCLLLVIGIFTRGITSGFILLINGIIIGIIIISYVPIGYNVIYPILALLPHAVFEIPAIILCASISSQKIKDLKNSSFSELIKVILLILILLIVGALIEVHISTKISKLLLPQ